MGGAFEAALVARKLRARTVWCVCLGLSVIVHVTSMLGFGIATSRRAQIARVATSSSARLPLVCYCLVMGTMGLNQSAWQQGYLDVGGNELEMLTSVGNMVANLPGVIVPMFGAALRSRFESWLPLFGLMAIVHGLSGLYFARAMLVYTKE
eukprot:COSAG05_NODE_570_length_8623_cov_35.317339_6_plen_151_part_00